MAKMMTKMLPTPLPADLSKKVQEALKMFLSSLSARRKRVEKATDFSVFKDATAKRIGELKTLFLATVKERMGRAVAASMIFPSTYYILGRSTYYILAATARV